jgi:hypothetical protein
MVAWKNQLGPSRIQDVVAYVLTLRNTNVPGKAPQGYDASGEPAPGWSPTGSTPKKAEEEPEEQEWGFQ